VKRQAEISEWLPGGLSPRPPAAGADDNGGTVDLNKVDFEQLLGLGIPVGQAARFISQRERRGGIRALNEVDGFHGLAPAVRDTLRRSGHL
jgi:hypothetical protein